ncbi:phosphatase PAP2 family protein [Tellurirhabdus rosea]|uniref:phosphatase PAP2 family protein n=1 Tax=Tellurirhabdus rosea TaxID=2674997 RepID=UPI00225C2564|nr:phosphatase PAP2 family protein [Tellurirhabdus rosea]
MKKSLVSLFLFWLSLAQVLAQSTAGDSLPTARRYPLKAFIVPSVLAAGGTALLSERIRDPFRSTEYVSRADDYLRFGPYAIRLGLQAAGVKPAVSVGDELVVTLLSNILMGGVTEGLKRSVGSTRPDGSDRKSFPSGHTSVAFTGAELLHQAYRHKSPWISVGGYTFAAATGLLRMANGRHHWSDVLAGAGIGIASVKATYAVYPFLKRKFAPRKARRMRIKAS